MNMVITETGAATAAAKALLKAHPELWQAWVTDAAARSKIQAAL